MDKKINGKQRNSDSGCYLCGATNSRKRKGIVRDNSSLDILECQNCGLVYLSSFDHIDDNFYVESGMHNGDINLDRWLKETRSDDERRFKFLATMMENKDILDFGCGNGGFLSMAKTVAKTVHGLELDQSVEQHFRNEAIPLFHELSEVNRKFDLITMFHVMEHLSDPARYLYSLSCHLSPNGKIIVEVPSSSDALLGIYDNESFAKFTYWSCHLFLFNQFTLQKLAVKAGLKVNYIKQVQRYPLSNHLHWLAKGKPGGHQEWGFLNSPDLHVAYEKQLAAIGACDTLIACFQKTK